MCRYVTLGSASGVPVPRALGQKAIAAEWAEMDEDEREPYHDEAKAADLADTVEPLPRDFVDAKELKRLEKQRKEAISAILADVSFVHRHDFLPIVYNATLPCSRYPLPRLALSLSQLHSNNRSNGLEFGLVYGFRDIGGTSVQEASWTMTLQMERVAAEHMHSFTFLAQQLDRALHLPREPGAFCDRL